MIEMPSRVEPFVWLALAVLLLFWAVGAYNRLMRLRNEIGAAWAQIDPLLHKRAGALEPLIDALREPLAGEAATLEAALAAQRELQKCADAMRHSPASRLRAQAFATALAPWTSALTRLLSLIEQQPDEVRGAEGVAAHLAAMREADGRWPFVRQAFNDAVQAYNDAIAQWPTRALARLFAFPPAGAL